MKPSKVVILGIEYKIIYVDKPSEVDIFKRESLWGQLDFWTRTIRIYDNNSNEQDILQVLLHEILHAIENDLKLKAFSPKINEEGHNELDILALALADTLTRNGWLKDE